eukprot:5033785-Lingulodinium_polyedra.AAC.1
MEQVERLQRVAKNFLSPASLNAGLDCRNKISLPPTSRLPLLSCLLPPGSRPKSLLRLWPLPLAFFVVLPHNPCSYSELLGHFAVEPRSNEARL